MNDKLYYSDFNFFSIGFLMRGKNFLSQSDTCPKH